MLSIQRPNPHGPPTRCTPHLLPCRIQHDGPVNASEKYWSPQRSTDGVSEAYFRGRKLQGREIKIPGGYSGIVVKAEAKELGNLPVNRERWRQKEESGHGVEDDGEEEVLKVLEEVGEFRGIMVWGHESIAGGDDTFVKGIEEWIGFADMIHRPGMEGGSQGEQR